MQLSEFSYHLPPERIAQRPLPDRAASRMLVIHRKEQRWEDRAFRDLPQFLRSGDCLVLNDTRVFPARLLGHRKGFTGKVEVFLVRPLETNASTWRALVRPGRKMRTGERLELGEGLEAEILGRNEFGERIVRLESDGDLYTKLDHVGHVPLPPYMHRDDTEEDKERYQTVYAGRRGSVAAPTAGLHFTPQILDACQSVGAKVAKVTLHVGLGTFQPLHTTTIEEVKLHSEWFSITPEAAATMLAASRLCAVGTTAVRTIETAMLRGGLAGMEAETDLFIRPGFDFQATGAMLTNFHLPQSSLLVLVCALAGRELVLSAYRHAVEDGYRFYSYGDSMLVV